MFSLPDWASAGLFTMEKLVGKLRVFLWNAAVLGDPYNTGIHKSHIVGSAKVLRITSYPTPQMSPWVIPTRIFLSSIRIQKY